MKSVLFTELRFFRGVAVILAIAPRYGETAVLRQNSFTCSFNNLGNGM
jgi:hypothetical protein